jgi:hypothetical protein
MFEAPSEVMRKALAAYCAAMADLTEDGRWKAAAGILTGERAGRAPVDDVAPLRYAQALLAAGAVRSIYRACTVAAQIYAPAHQTETMRDRLRRKFRTQPIMSGDAAQKRA